MFGFRSSNSNMPRGNVFDIEEIRQLVLDFPVTNDKHQADNLVPLASNTGYTTRNALQTAFARLLRSRPGSIPLSVLYSELDAHPPDVAELVQSRKDYILSKSRDSLLSAQAQERLINTLQRLASERYIRATEFANEHDLDVQSIPRLLAVGDDSTHETTLQLLDAPGVSTRSSLELGHSYIHTLGVLLSLKSQLEAKAEEAQSLAKIAVFVEKDLFGLESKVFSQLAQEIAQSAPDNGTYDGSFEAHAEEVRFIPKPYLLRKVRKSLKEVAIGAEPFCDLAALVKAYPTVLLDIEAARGFAQDKCVHKDGSKYTWHFVSHYAFSDVALNSTAQACHETLGSQLYLNTKPFVQSFPTVVHDDLMIILQDRIHQIFQCCGGNMGNILGLDEYMIFKTFISDLGIAAERIARQEADASWQANPGTSSSLSSSDMDILLLKLHDQSGVPVELLRRLWADSRVTMKRAASAAYSERTAGHQSERTKQAEFYWRTRVAYPMHLHETALIALTPGQLAEQLSDLLCVHITQDIIPNALKRMQSKGFVLTSSAQKEIEKLKIKLADKEQTMSTIIQSLTSFGKKMGYSTPSDEDYKDAREKHLRDLLQSMQSDTDDPRLFLGAMIILLSQVQGNGVVYATGKFAPRLLKVLKEDLDTETVQVLEQIKDKVKASTVDEVDRQRLKDIALKALHTLGVQSTGVE